MTSFASARPSKDSYSWPLITPRLHNQCIQLFSNRPQYRPTCCIFFAVPLLCACPLPTFPSSKLLSHLLISSLLSHLNSWHVLSPHHISSFLVSSHSSPLIPAYHLLNSPCSSAYGMSSSSLSLQWRHVQYGNGGHERATSVQSRVHSLSPHGIETHVNTISWQRWLWSKIPEYYSHHTIAFTSLHECLLVKHKKSVTTLQPQVNVFSRLFNFIKVPYFTRYSSVLRKCWMMILSYQFMILFLECLLEYKWLFEWKPLFIMVVYIS